jgi:arylsulfatase A-like enzyme
VGCRPNDEESVRRTLARYWGLTSQVDHQFGRVLNALAESGQWDDTMVVFTSDHGDQMGSHELIAKGVFYEESARVPLVIKAAGQRNGGRVAGPVSQIDLAATIADLAGARAVDTDGASLRPAMESGAAPGRDVALIWHAHDGSDSGDQLAGQEKLCEAFGTMERCRQALHGEARGLVSPDGWKLIVSALGECEMYDLTTDPLEMRNRAHDPAVHERRRDLVARMRRWQREYGDPLRIAGLEEP